MKSLFLCEIDSQSKTNENDSMKKNVLTKIRKISAVYLNLTAKVFLTTISSHNEFNQLIKS